MTSLFDRINTYLAANISLSSFTIIDGRKQRTAATTFVFRILTGSASINNIVAGDAEIGINYGWGIEIQASTEANLELAIEDIIPLIHAYTAVNKRWQPQQIGDVDVRYGVYIALFGCVEIAENAEDDW